MVVETLRALRGGSLPEDTSALPLPERVRDLIAHRLERLGDRSRRLLAVAAVVGRPFDFALLQRAADLGEAEAAEGVEELVRHRVLHGSGEGLEFTHDRIREVVYGQLLPARRALLHRRVAEALEALHAGALEPHALALGTHYWEGEAWAKAVVYLAQAGVLASLRYAKRDAVSCYEQALAALAHLPESRQTREQAAEVRFNLAHSLFSVGQFERAKESFLVAEDSRRGPRRPPSPRADPRGHDVLAGLGGRLRGRDAVGAPRPHHRQLARRPRARGLDQHRAGAGVFRPGQLPGAPSSACAG